MASHLHLAPLEPNGAVRHPVPSPIRVLLADDHALVRRSLRLLLEGEENVEVVAEASDLDSAARHLTGHDPHVLVLDLQLPGTSSEQLVRQLRRRFPGTEIVVLTMEESPSFARSVLEAGARGLVLKHRADCELPAAVTAAARRERYVSPRVAVVLRAAESARRDDGLSERETEILRLLALGYTSIEMAHQLHLSRRTVETHRARIHRKLGLRTRAELVRYALQGHLIGG